MTNRLGAWRVLGWAAVALTGMAQSARAQTWEPYASFPTGGAPRLDCIGLSESGEVLALAGSPYVGGPTGDSAVHGTQPGSGVWVAHEPFEGPIIGQGVGIDALGRIVVFGGVDGPDPEGDLGVVWAWDRVEGKLDELPERSVSAAVDQFAFATDEWQRIYSIGGDAAAVGGSTYSTLVQRYDALSDTWSTLTPLPLGLVDAVAVADGNGHVHVIGGRSTAQSARSDVLTYDIAANAWSSTALPDMPVARHSMRAAFGAEGRLYVVGGSDASGNARADTWVFDPSSATWSAGPTLAVARHTFGLALGADGYLYAMGGRNAQGGTNTVERLRTSICPLAGAVPAAMEIWSGLATTLEVFFAGAEPLDYRWQKDGVDLVDGVTPGGSVLSGVNTPSLHIAAIGSADVGDYRLVATNTCGSDASATIHVGLRSAPTIGTWATVQRLDTWGAGAVNAAALDGLRILGNGVLPFPPHGNQPRAIEWNAAGDVVDTSFTPANSAGSSVHDAADGRAVGWWWWPYTVPRGTGYYQHACTWDPVTGALVELQPSGWEIGSVSATNGSQHVGTLRWSDESTNSDAAFWPTSQASPLILTPSGAWGSSGTAIDDAHQYGSTHIGFGVVHASRWSGSAATYEDWNPPGASSSGVAAASDGLVVGSASIGGSATACVWGDGPADVVAFQPAGATAVTLYDTLDGYLLGSATLPGLGARAALWLGIDGPMIDLTALAAPGGFTSVAGFDLDVLPNGHVRVLGSGTTGATSVPLVWHFQREPLSALPTAVSLAQGGRHELHLAAGTAHAHQFHVVLGSATGTSPAVPLDGLFLVPLVPDAYTLWTLNLMGSAVLPGSFGVLDEFGGGHAALAIPPGASAALVGLQLHHAFLTWNAQGALDFVSNACPVELLP